MAKAVSMKDIWRSRRLILEGNTVKEVSKRTGLSESVIRSYTKSERSRVKELKGG